MRWMRCPRLDSLHSVLPYSCRGRCRISKKTPPPIKARRPLAKHSNPIGAADESERLTTRTQKRVTYADANASKRGAADEGKNGAASSGSVLDKSAAASRGSVLDKPVDAAAAVQPQALQHRP